MTRVPLRIAVAGAGLIGRTHLGALADAADCAVSAIADPSPLADELAAHHGVPRYDTLDALLDRHRPDGVIIATPNALHVQQALVCLSHGVPMLIEKPVAPRVEHVAPLLDASSTADVPILIGHHRAYSPIMETARSIVASGELGRVVAITGSAAFYKPDTYFDAAPWRREPGGGPVLINLIHDVHAYRSLGGPIEAVQAMASNAIRGHAVEDTVTINLRFADGALGNFLLSDTAASSRSWEQTSAENPAYAHDATSDCYHVAGTDGALSIPTLRLQRYSGAAERSWWKPFVDERREVERLDPIARQLAHFAAVVRGEDVPRVTLADGLANLAVTEAVLEAAATGRTVRVAD